jgi:hypothetical protein
LTFFNILSSQSELEELLGREVVSDVVKQRVAGLFKDDAAMNHEAEAANWSTS